MSAELTILGNIIGLSKDIGNLADYSQACKKQCYRLATRCQGIVNLLEPLRGRLSNPNSPPPNPHLLVNLELLERAMLQCQDHIKIYTTRQWAKSVFVDAANPQRFDKLNRDLSTAAETLSLGPSVGALFNRADDVADLTADIGAIGERQDEIVRLVLALDGQGDQADMQRQMAMSLSSSKAFLPKPDVLVKDAMQSLVEDFIVPWSELKLIRRLGGGAFGEVHLAKWRGIDDVAVKILKSNTTFSMKREIAGQAGGGAPLGGTSKEDQKAVEEFMNELKLMAKLRHPNVVQLMAVVLEPNRKALIMEYMATGSLFDVIGKKALTWPQIISIANDIAKGCAYLIRMGVLHRDLKSGNVMVRDDLSAAKICDFGLSQNLRSQSKDVVGSIRWIAPELFSLTPNTEKSDVFAFGMILYELVSRRLPFHDLNDEQVEKAYRSGQRPPIPPGVPRGFASIIEHCWAQDPAKRPTFAQMIEQGWFNPPENQPTPSKPASEPHLRHPSSVSGQPDHMHSSVPSVIPPPRNGSMPVDGLARDFANMSMHGNQGYQARDPYGRPMSYYGDYGQNSGRGSGSSGLQPQLRIPRRVESKANKKQIERLGTSLGKLHPGVVVVNDHLFASIMVKIAQRISSIVALLEPLRQRLSYQNQYPDQALTNNLRYLERVLTDSQDLIGTYTTRNWAKAVFTDAANPQRFEKLNRDLLTAAEQLNLGPAAKSLFSRSDDAADLSADIQGIGNRQDDIIRLVMAYDAHMGGGAPNLGDPNELRRQFAMAMSSSKAFVPKNDLVSEAMRALIDDFVVPWSELKLMKRLGGGAFGEVHLAKWRGIDDVAVKILKSNTTFSMRREINGDGTAIPNNYRTGMSKEDQKANEEFMNELKLMAKLRHPNIVQLMAVVLEPNRKALIMEFMPAGSLFDVVTKRSLTWPQIISIANDIAKGCAYLIKMGVLHRDLKSGNVMVRDDLSAAKICDFGLSQNLRAKSKDVVGSIRWIAPELFDLTPNTEKSDVFAFGMILYELVSRRLPFHEYNDEQVEASYRRGLRPPIPEKVPAGFKSIIEHCWHQDPGKRPTFVQMIEEGWFESNPTPASAAPQRTATVQHGRPYPTHNQSWPSAGAAQPMPARRPVSGSQPPLKIPPRLESKALGATAAPHPTAQAVMNGGRPVPPQQPYYPQNPPQQQWHGPGQYR
ncbi:copper transport protein ctr1 [Gonapodya sp. JEL0774]|nr:copper transport protein ctr1 [Gonapodya sp. JEL0774]